MRILTDFERFPQKWKTTTSVEGQTRMALVGATPKDVFRLIPEIRQADLLLVHQDAFKAFWLVLLFWIVPFLKKPIVVVDLVMRRPRTSKEKALAEVKKILLKGVDHFIHYFQDLRLYNQLYGISPARSSFVPFKSNIFGRPDIAVIARAEKEEYVFAVGWSLRDYDTFFDAVERAGFPAAIPQPNFERLRENGSRFTRRMEDLPKNLVLLEHQGDRESWIRNLCKARIVVVPLLRDILNSSMSVYLDAMLLGKCVIVSDSPGVTGILTDQAVVVPPEDPAALAAAIKKVWENQPLREDIATRGQRYAAALGGEPELMTRILEQTVSWYRGLACRAE